MPGLDGSGPQGRGSMTGRGMGRCGSMAWAGMGRGRNLAMGRGMGRGRGYGRGRNFAGRGFFPADAPFTDSPAQLEAYLNDLRGEMAEVEARLAGLQKQED